jgi:glycopeptide antibiotics resistance protein
MMPFTINVPLFLLTFPLLCVCAWRGNKSFRRLAGRAQKRARIERKAIVGVLFLFVITCLWLLISGLRKQADFGAIFSWFCGHGLAMGIAIRMLRDLFRAEKKEAAGQ